MTIVKTTGQRDCFGPSALAMTGGGFRARNDEVSRGKDGGKEMTREEVLCVEEISDILRISSNTIQRKSWREKTGCPIRKKGKRLFSLATEFHSWMRS